MSGAPFSHTEAIVFFLSDHKKSRLSGIRASCAHWGEAGVSGKEMGREEEEEGEIERARARSGSPLDGGSGSQHELQAGILKLDP